MVHLRIVVPQDYTLVLRRGALISKEAPNLIGAKRFLDYLLSERGQRVSREKAFFFAEDGPLPKGVDGPETLKESGVARPIRIGPYLLAAQASKADSVAWAISGGVTVNRIKQAAEFGITTSGQRLAGLLIYITDVHSVGLELAQGLVLVSPFYWDMNDGTRKFSERFAALKSGAKPSMVQAGVYASIVHYLKAVEALGSAEDGAKVVAKMKEMPTDDPLFGKGYIRADGRKMHPMYLFQVKKPAESKYPWDYYTYKAEIPAEIAFRPMDEGGCPLVTKKLN